MANDSLLNAKMQKNDEFYTLYEYIQKEINAYLEYNPNVFKNKTVLLPCDDPEWSNFTKFFAQNFEMLGLKKLISTSYAIANKKEKYDKFHEISLFETSSPNYNEAKSQFRGKIFVLERDTNNSGNIDINDLEWKYLKEDGDFRSKELLSLRDQADIIVTNPPFSLIREFIDWVFEGSKKCIIIGTIGAASYKEIFPLIKNNKLWIGATNNRQDMVFEVPIGAKVKLQDKIKAEKLGYTGNYTRLGNVCWYTNVDHGRRHQPLVLMTMADNLKFSKHKDLIKYGYAKYENFDAIEIPYVDAIPSDYDGKMGVPSTFLDRYNPEQFTILGLAHGNLGVELGIKPYKRKLKKENKGLRDGDFYFFKDGKPQIPYSRIVIERKK